MTGGHVLYIPKSQGNTQPQLRSGTQTWLENPAKLNGGGSSWEIHIWLVVSTPLKNMKFSWDDDIPNIWKMIKFHGSSHHQPVMDFPGGHGIFWVSPMLSKCHPQSWTSGYRTRPRRAVQSPRIWNAHADCATKNQCRGIMWMWGYFKGTSSISRHISWENGDEIYWGIMEYNGIQWALMGFN